MGPDHRVATLQVGHLEIAVSSFNVPFVGHQSEVVGDRPPNEPLPLLPVPIMTSIEFCDKGHVFEKG